MTVKTSETGTTGKQKSKVADRPHAITIILSASTIVVAALALLLNHCKEPATSESPRNPSGQVAPSAQTKTTPSSGSNRDIGKGSRRSQRSHALAIHTNAHRITAPNAAASSGPTTINNCANAICISGGTVSNPTVINTGPPPAMLNVSPGPKNEPSQTFRPGLPPNLILLYRSSYSVHVTDAVIPNLVISVQGADLRQVECGQVNGMVPAVPAIHGVASCTMNSVFGNNWFFSVLTTAPQQPGDVHIDIVCSDIRCTRTSEH